MSYNSNLERDEFPQQYGNDYFIEDIQYGPSNYVQEFEFDSHKMSYEAMILMLYVMKKNPLLKS